MMKIVFSCVPKGFRWHEDSLFLLTFSISEYLGVRDMESETTNPDIGGYGQEIHVKVVGVSTTVPPTMLRNIALKIFQFLKLHDLVESSDVCFPGHKQASFFVESDFPELKKKTQPPHKS